MGPLNDILIVGGGTAGWITAAVLAKRLGADRPDGVRITLVESADIGTIGVGEGTFPTMRRTPCFTLHPDNYIEEEIPDFF